jgi:hypothetical protein
VVSEKEPFEALLHEFAGERAHALGRIASRMERALADLRAFDRGDVVEHAGEPGEPAVVPTREDLVATAAEWVWFYIVQRDVLGWHRHDEAIRYYDVPAEVMARLGPRRRAPS